MVVGLIHDIPSVRELVDRIMSEAEEIINKRLKGMVSDRSASTPSDSRQRVNA
jgi:nitronate monooxygenase